MIFLDDQHPFDTGPASVHAHGLDLRFAGQPSPDAPGHTLVPQGNAPRTLEQAGTLLGDDIDELAGQVAAIEALIDGQPRTLIDQLGRVWSNVVLLRFVPAPVTRRGARLALPYRVVYQQPAPTPATTTGVSP